MHHIALLRGINVGGHRKVPMRDLKATFERLGLAEVRTYIQSGNVLFRAEAADREAIENAIEQDFGFPVDVMLRSEEEWAALAPRTPYLAEAAADGTRVHVAFLHHEPRPEHLAALRARPTGDDRWEAAGRELYLHTPNGLGQSKLDLSPLRQPVTVRNWRTVQVLAEMLGG